ncbi:LpqB family beta-propeller domain-containing protein [Branchiibius sp. NY16-3462-2]|uniref:LpqB family beta-propeller domain-containing protein n=1 Tax=Branchiibius sp. NY16-3462-2 TaxID=1807500 RepID=UPI00079AB2C6|nr:LpqB family beta-propeller domain-containing protein [Branchiibius sp. NY16-3462-2]KYH42952.1 hypothetical protein AZH51_05715 [Branchiibius sp. NY16-3462-2]
MRRTRLLLVLLALAMVGTLSACSGLPSSSPVQARASIAPEPAPVVNVRPPGPATDASARDIVRGFLRANAYTTDDYSVAREFLTGAASATWDPKKELSINTGERDFVDSMTDARTVSVTARQSALLDADGRLRDTATPQTRTGSFTMQRVDGQWRISALPKGFGAWISQDDFDVSYTAQKVYYAVPATKTLVADVRWFPLSGLTTALARAVLRPPPAYLSPVVTAQMPQGTLLRVDAVPVDTSTGVATVDLTSAALTASPAQRTALWAQMLATLSLTRGVRSVVITVDGAARLETPDLPQDPTSPEDLGYTVVQVNRTELIARSADQLRWFNPAAGASAGGSSSVALPSVAKTWTQLGVSADGRQVVAVSADGTTMSRWVAGRQFTRPVFGTQLTRPSFASRTPSEIWVAGTPLTPAPGSAGSAVWFISTSDPPQSAPPQPVDLPWLGAATITAIAVAADGDRIAMVVRSDSGATHINVSSIIRDASGHPTALSTPLVVGDGLQEVRDVTWLDDSTLGVLARSIADNGAVQAVQVPIGGLLEDLGQDPKQPLLAIRGVGDGPSDVYLITTAGQVLIHEGATWSPMSGLSDLVVPGT